MKIITEVRAEHLQTWAGATPHYKKICEAGKLEEFEEYIEEMYPDGIGETELNDLLWFYWEELFDILGIEYDIED